MMISIVEAYTAFLAAVQAVAPQAVGSTRSSVGSADDLLGWITATDVPALLGRLSDAELDDLRLVLNGMLRESRAS